MFFGRVALLAIPLASAVSAIAIKRGGDDTGSGGGGDTGSDCPTPDQWDDAWAKCGSQDQTGLINVAIEACVAAEIDAIALLLTGKPVPASSWETAWADCGKQSQTGLINVEVEACVVAEVDAIIQALTKRAVVKRGGDDSGGDGGDTGSDCPTPDQWDDAWAKCGGQDQTGLINVALEACVAAEIDAIALLLTGKPVPASQWTAAWADCGSQSQTGLINVAVEACVVAEVDAIIQALTKRAVAKRGGDDSGGDGGDTGSCTKCPTPDQWDDAWAKCEGQDQTGLVNVALEACVVAEVDAIVLLLTGKPVTATQWSKAWADCSKQSQDGLINVAVEACVVAEIDAIVEAL